MPPAINLEHHRHEIEHRILTLKQSQQEIVSWLKNEHDINITIRTLISRCKFWGISRRTQTASSDPILIRAIGVQFHTTVSNDTAIALSLKAQNINTTSNQVKEIRNLMGW